jgi:hypothetical protein
MNGVRAGMSAPPLMAAARVAAGVTSLTCHNRKLEKYEGAVAAAIAHRAFDVTLRRAPVTKDPLKRVLA